MDFFFFFLQITLERSYLLKGRLAQTVLWTSQNGEKLRKKKITSPKKIIKKAKVIHLKNSTFNKLTQPANPPPQIYSFF